MNPNLYIVCLIAWPAMGAFLFTPTQSGKGVGLNTAFLALLGLNHWFGALVCNMPQYVGTSFDNTASGFLESTIGMLSFSAGCFLVGRTIRSSSENVGHEFDQSLAVKVERQFLLGGILLYALFFAGLGRIPTINSLTLTGSYLALAGISLKIKRALDHRDTKKAYYYIAWSLALPAMTLVMQGFIGYGTTYFLILFFFFSSRYRNRLVLLAATVLFTYVGLSAYVTYMRDRFEIRERVWGGESLQSRFDRIAETILTPEAFDFSNQEHLERVDRRLNQNYLVGAAVKYLDEVGGFAYGKTLWMSVVALIPRALWPDKPVSAGSGDMVAENTGLTFGEGTSVGMGYIFEFYINFGRIGVIVGMFLVGVIVTTANQKAAGYLRVHDYWRFARWFLIGIALLNVLGSMVEITVSVAASVAIVGVYKKVIGGLTERKASRSAKLVFAPGSIEELR